MLVVERTRTLKTAGTFYFTLLFYFGGGPELFSGST